MQKSENSTNNASAFTVNQNPNQNEDFIISKNRVDKYSLINKSDDLNNKKTYNDNFDVRNKISKKNAFGKDYCDGTTFNLNIYQDKNKIDCKIMKIVEKKSIYNKPRNDCIPESMFLNLKRLREEYTKVYEKYKDSIKQ